MGSRKSGDAASVSLVIDSEGLKPSTIPPRVAADLINDFVGLLEDLADELGVGKGQLIGLEIQPGSLGIATSTKLPAHSKVLETGVRRSLGARQPGEATRAPTPRQQRIEKRARSIRRSVLTLGPRVRVSTKVGKRLRKLPLLFDEEASPALELVTARVLFQGMHALDEGSRASFIGVLDHATYSLAASAEHEQKLLKLYRGELEIEAEIHVAADGSLRGKLLDIDEIEEGEGTDLEAWQRWFASTGWEKLTLDEAERELTLGE